MSEPVSASSSLSEQPGAGPQRPHWGNRLAILGVLALVLGPFSLAAVPREIARWYAAAANNAHWQDNYELALENLDQAIAWDPSNPEWYLARSQVHENHQHLEAALVDCDAALELDPESSTALIQHSEICIRLKKYDAAMEDWKTLRAIGERDGNYDLRMLYNGTAYNLALVNRDLDEALSLANQALAKDPRNEAILDTRGFIYYRQGKYAEARSDLDQAVTLAGLQLPDQEKMLRQNISDSQQYERSLKALRETMAVMLYHRSLVLDKMGLSAEAALDRDRVRDYGFTPDEDLF